MAIKIYDQDTSPVENTLSDDGVTRAPVVIGDSMYCGTSAIADGSTYRVELRITGQVPPYNLTAFPSPSPIAAVQINDSSMFINSIVGHPSGAIFFVIKASAAGDTDVWRYSLPDLKVDDGPNLAADMPLLGVLNEEVAACYTSAIRIRSSAGVWANATITPAPSSYVVRGVHAFLGVLYFLVDAVYGGTTNAEVWKYTGNNAAITLDQSYTSGSGGFWNYTSVAGGLFSGALYGDWLNGATGVSTLVRRSSSAWSNVKTSLLVGKIVEFKGAIFGITGTTLLSPGTDPTGTWATVSSSFPADIIVF